MKLTSKKLKQIIKKEMKKLQEGRFGPELPPDPELSHMGTTYAPPGSPSDRPATTWEDDLEMKWDSLSDDQREQIPPEAEGEELLAKIEELEAEIARLKGM